MTHFKSLLTWPNKFLCLKKSIGRSTKTQHTRKNPQGPSSNLADLPESPFSSNLSDQPLDFGLNCFSKLCDRISRRTAITTARIFAALFLNFASEMWKHQSPLTRRLPSPWADFKRYLNSNCICPTYLCERIVFHYFFSFPTWKLPDFHSNLAFVWWLQLIKDGKSFTSRDYQKFLFFTSFFRSNIINATCTLQYWQS